MWVEWDETGRNRLREVLYPHQKWAQDLSQQVLADKPIPTRVGFLLECEDNSLRRGKVVWLWYRKDAKLADVPNVGPFSPHFDLDKQFPLQHPPLTLSRFWKDHPIQTRALNSIWQTAEHLPYGDWGSHVASEYLHTEQEREESLADVYGEYIMVWTILLLLTSSRKIVNLEPVSLQKLNKARLRRNEIPRLDYTLVNLYIDPSSLALSNAQRPTRAMEGVARGPLLHPRKPPRIHMVSSYLARRGSKHWVVHPYWRGSGKVISRHTYVKSVTSTRGDK
jgi:hypothetical protein